MTHQLDVIVWWIRLHNITSLVVLVLLLVLATAQPSDQFPSLSSLIHFSHYNSFQCFCLILSFLHTTDWNSHSISASTHHCNISTGIGPRPQAPTLRSTLRQGNNPQDQSQDWGRDHQDWDKAIPSRPRPRLRQRSSKLGQGNNPQDQSQDCSRDHQDQYKTITLKTKAKTEAEIIKTKTRQ